MSSNSDSIVSQLSDEIATCTWSIKKFPQFTTGFQCSAVFPVNLANRFYLRCHPKFADEEIASYFPIYLKRSEPFESDVRVQCRLAILDRELDECLTKEFTVTFSALDRDHSFDDAIYALERAYILDEFLMTNDSLIIYCEVKVLSDQSNKVKSKVICNIGCERITEDLSTLLESGKFSDVLFVVGDKVDEKKEFRLHKNILAARSEVFNAMLTADCEEKRKNRVEITDMNVSVFEEMIRYIYTGKAGKGLELYAEELFVAADKYQLDLLKTEAAHELASMLSIESVSGVLLLAEMHSDAQLKADCIKYITQHSKEVMQTEAWKVAIEPRADLLIQLYRELSNSK